VKGYLYVIDQDGAEVPESRRYLEHCQSREDLLEVRRELERKMGEDCMVLDSEVDRGPRTIDHGG
jgi:hypothetical protein